MNNKIVIGGVILALVLSVLAITNKPTERVVETIIEKQLGASPGPTRTWSEESIGGLGFKYVSLPLRSGTSTPCAFQGPAATSTVTTSLSITTSTSTALTWAVSTSTRAQGYATTTPFYTRAVAANAQDQTVVAPTLIQTNVVPPGGWVTWSAYGTGMGGTANAGVITAGTCTAVFTVIK
jgi:hypothetical protein